MEHIEIEYNRGLAALEMVHVTERAGSPQTLVCTKDNRTFKARVKEYREEIAAMRKLMQLAPGIADAPAIGARLAAAVEASQTLDSRLSR